MRRYSPRIAALGLRTVVAVGVASFSMSALSGGYVGWGAVSYMQSAYGGWLLQFQGAVNNPDNCSQGEYVILLPTHPQYKELYTFLLAAHLTKEQLTVYVDGCHSAGYKLLSFVAAQ